MISVRGNARGWRVVGVLATAVLAANVQWVATGASAPPTSSSPAVAETTAALPIPEPPPADPEAEEPEVVLGRIELPTIGVDAVLYEGVRIPTLDRGPGHWPGTAMPGQAGNMVVGGHRTSSNHDFADLGLLEPGDPLVVTDSAGARFTYLVDSTQITGPFALRVLYQTPHPTATLFACHPPGEVIQRIVVHLTLADQP